MPKRYRKKPVIVEAGHFDRPDKGQRIAEWCGGVFHDDDAGDPFITLPTLEGVMEATLGDFVIKGTRGEFYPCKEDPFWDTFELVEDDE